MEWFLDLLSLSVASPVVLLYRIDLLWQLHFHFLHQDLRVFVFLLGDSSAFCSTFLACLGAWPISALCAAAVPPGAFACAGGIVVGVSATVRIIQSQTFLFPRLQVSVLSLYEGTSLYICTEGVLFRLPFSFPYKLPELWVSFVLWNLIRSFEVMRSLMFIGPPS